jgi:hypothetical protein
MTKYINLVLIVLCILLLVPILWLGGTFVILYGFPVSKVLKIEDYTATYDEYLLPREWCQEITYGHCETVEMNKYHAQADIARQMCADYSENATPELQSQILDLEFVNFEAGYFLEQQEEACEQNQPGCEDRAALFCQNVDQVLPYIVII